MVRGLEDMISEKEMEGTRLIEPGEEKVLGGNLLLVLERQLQRRQHQLLPEVFS